MSLNFQKTHQIIYMDRKTSIQPSPPRLLLVNPWIHDFAAFDLWSKPLGLLYLASFLREKGYRVHFLDCLDIYHPAALKETGRKSPKRKKYGTGKFFKQTITPPRVLEHINRPYSRYGLPPSVIISELKKIPEPAAILVTSLMTYWYPGIAEFIKIAKQVFPKVPVILGGIYARLCQEHATKFSGADYVVTSQKGEDVQELLSTMGIHPAPLNSLSGQRPTYPAFDLLRKINYVCIVTSRGCPYNCSYCATGFLNPVFSQRNWRHVLEEIIYWHSNYGARDFAFYDDALLIDPKNHFVPLANALITSGIPLRFHTPNALHIRQISLEIATLLKKSGFTTIRLGLETSDFQFRNGLDTKVSQGEFEVAVENLLKADFAPQQIGVYILVGLPHQSIKSVMETIEFVGNARVMPFLAEYSPIPHTGLWDEAVKVSEYDLISEPLFHNNTLLPCWDESKRKQISELKAKVLAIRQRLNKL